MTDPITAPQPCEREVLRSTSRRSAEGAEVEETEWRAGPGWSALPLHRHLAEEHYEVLDGSVRVLVDGAGRTYRSGESAIVAAHQEHTLEPVDGHGLHVRVLRWSPPRRTDDEPHPDKEHHMSMTLHLPADDRVVPLLVRPGDDGWDAARSAWNLTVDQHPVAVALPETDEDVVALVAYARSAGLRIAPQGTGHSAAAIAGLEGALLVKTSRLRDVAVDPEARTVRIGAGVLSEEVVAAAQEHGLAALVGSSPDVGVVGYTLGGGVSWLGRAHGLSCNKVRAIELVTADGRLVRTTAEEEPELFWALRGGGGSFGIVTAMELELLPIAEVFAGALFWPVERASEVLHAWRELTSRLPEEMSSVARIVQVPPLPDVPEPLRGRSFAIVEAIFLGDAEEGSRLLEPLRALQPEIDTLAVIPTAELIHLHMDPPHPVPGMGDGGILRELPAEAVDAVLAIAGPGTASPLAALDIRHVGGALRRPPEGHGALAGLDGEFLFFAVGAAATPELGAAISGRIAALGTGLAPWTADTSYLNFVEHPVDAAGFYPAGTYRRLQEAKRRYDPTEVLLANHPIPPAGG